MHDVVEMHLACLSDRFMTGSGRFVSPALVCGANC